MDTTNIDPATLLNLAADRLEALAARATPGPWFFQRSPDGDHDELEVLAGQAAASGGGSGRSEEFIVESRDIDYLWQSATEPGEQVELLVGAHEWMATMHPGVTAPLVGWLRHEAQQFRQQFRAAERVSPVLAAMTVRTPGLREVLAFARVVLASAPEREDATL